jgi:hypothetical protein
MTPDRDAWVAHDDDHCYVNQCVDSHEVYWLDHLEPWSTNKPKHYVLCHEERQTYLAHRAQQLQRYSPLQGVGLFLV